MFSRSTAADLVQDRDASTQVVQIGELGNHLDIPASAALISVTPHFSDHSKVLFTFQFFAAHPTVRTSMVQILVPKDITVGFESDSPFPPLTKR